MDKFLFVTFLWLFFIEYSFAQSEHSVRECFVKNGNTEIIISHSNAIYSIAQYFDMIDENSKYEQSPDASHRYIPENDSIPFYSDDEYHNELFKLTRKILYSNYDSIISYINNTGLLDGSPIYRDSVYKVLFFYKWSGENFCYSQQDKYGLLSYDSFNMAKQMSALSGFAEIIHYNDFFRENYNAYYDYMTNIVPCIEDMRIWMNEVFDVNYERFDFLTSPFSDPFCLELYENEDDYDEMAQAGIAENKITLKKGEFFVLGDNRNNSEDSRSANIGIVSKKNIIGKAWIHLGAGDNTIGFVK